jgi:serine protease AprX
VFRLRVVREMRARVGTTVACGDHHAASSSISCKTCKETERLVMKERVCRVAVLLTMAFIHGVAAASAGGLDPLAQARASSPFGQSRVVVMARDAASLAPLTLLIQQLGGTPGRLLGIINGRVATVPNSSLNLLAANALVLHVAFDRLISGAMERTGPTIGAAAVRSELGLDGSGVGVAIIDSGVTAWHDDLSDSAQASQRVDGFVDFVDNSTVPSDAYGHGTHVAGIIAGNGADSSGARSGIAPAARLLVLKVLDGSGNGRISDVIAALDYVVTRRADFNIRVVNLSIATGVYESYNADPLTLAAQRAVDAGIVVVASAGNNGRNGQGQTQYGGITAPGNAPWVLTVGASSHMGTIDRSDDTVAAFSSRGPTAIDRTLKPDLLAPGVGIESLSVPGSTLYNTRSAYLLPGTVSTAYPPYLSLSGTSQAAPVVAGTVALMLQANPALTPNAVKAVLQFTAQRYAAYDVLTQGAGFLDARGAVELAAYLASASGPYPDDSTWSHQLLWGGGRVNSGRLTTDANAWSIGTVWGSPTSASGDAIVWGSICSANCDTADAAVWSAWNVNCSDSSCTASAYWSGAFWATSDGDTVVWGTTDGDTVVWGTNDGDTVVWGTTDGDTVVWGTTCSDPSCSAMWPSQ